MHGGQALRPGIARCGRLQCGDARALGVCRAWAHFRLRTALCPNTSLLIGHEATASLPLLASSSSKVRHRIRKRPKSDRLLAFRGVPGEAGGATEIGPMPEKPFIYRFSADLRLEDHAGLAAAASRGCVLPIIVIDDALASRLKASPRRAAFFCSAVAALASELGEMGSRLVVRRGPAGKDHRRTRACSRRGRGGVECFVRRARDPGRPATAVRVGRGRLYRASRARRSRYSA